MASRSKASNRLRRLVGLGAIAGALYALWRLLDSRQRESGLDWQPQPFPFPPRPVPVPPDPSTDTHTQISVGWVEPADGACPATHPLKAKLGSGIYHAPGMQMYERTRADRCYADAASAEADGLRASKR